jgi:hypothetical protein
MHPGQVESGDLSPSGPRGVSRDGHAPNQFCDISGLRVELSEPCNSTHKPRGFEGQRLAKAASFALLKPARRHNPTYEKDMILLKKSRFVLVIPTFQRIFDQVTVIVLETNSASGRYRTLSAMPRATSFSSPCKR